MRESIMSRSASRWLLTASLIGCSLLASCQCPKVRLVGVGKDRAPSQTSRLLRVRVLLLSAHGADQFRRSSFEQLWPAWKDSAANADAFSVPGLDESKGEQAILDYVEIVFITGVSPHGEVERGSEAIAGSGFILTTGSWIKWILMGTGKKHIGV